MVTEEEYLKAKAIVDQYRKQQEYQQARIEATYFFLVDRHTCFTRDINSDVCEICGETKERLYVVL